MGSAVLLQSSSESRMHRGPDTPQKGRQNMAPRVYLVHVSPEKLVVPLEAVDEALGGQDACFPLVRADLHNCTSQPKLVPGAS